jgi:hypothetical protein
MLLVGWLVTVPDPFDPAQMKREWFLMGAAMWGMGGFHLLTEWILEKTHVE